MYVDVVTRCLAIFENGRSTLSHNAVEVYVTWTKYSFRFNFSLCFYKFSVLNVFARAGNLLVKYLFPYNIHVYTSNWLRHLWIVQLTCYHPHPVTPGTCPAFRTRGWGIVWGGPVLEVGGWGKWKMSSLWFAKYKSFLAQFTRWLRTSTLRICKEKRREYLRVVGEE